MLVPNCHANTPEYRYGFQGQEMDDELKGEGNSLNYTFRMHDPRVGRFFAVDPLSRKYPYYSTYAFSGNRVIDVVELEGLEPGSLLWGLAKQGIFGETVQTITKGADNVVRSAASSVVTVSSAVIVPIVNQTSVVWNEGVHAGGAYKKAHNVWQPGVRKLNENWELEIIEDGDEAAKEVLLSTVDIWTTVLPIEKLAAPVIKTISIPIFRAGAHLITPAKNLFGGSVITLSKRATTTVVGRFKGGVEYIKATGMFRMGKNSGGVNILNVPDKLYKKAIAEGGDELFWNKYNKPWLDEAIGRGDDIRLVSDPTDPVNLYLNKVDDSGGRTMFGREVEYLEKNNYIFEGANAIKK